MQKNVLVIGANGQIGSDLIVKLTKLNYNVFALDVKDDKIKKANEKNILSIPFIQLNLEPDKKSDPEGEKIKKELIEIIETNEIDHIYHLVAKVSGAAAEKPIEAWNLNVGTLLTILEIARERIKDNEDNVVNPEKQKKPLRIFWPSSMAAFGKKPPLELSGELDKRYDISKQFDPLLPETIYGASKVTGESLCSYYARREKVDIRSIRYPGLISYNTLGGGGTTDYAIHIYFYCRRQEAYKFCFISEDIRMEMMYMPDALEATVMLMEADDSRIIKGVSYNLKGIDFTPKEIALEIKKHYPNFKLECFKDDDPKDTRIKNALSWPEKINDAYANSWGWNESKLKYDLKEMTKDMFLNLDPKLLDEWEQENNGRNQKNNLNRSRYPVSLK